MSWSGIGRRRILAVGGLAWAGSGIVAGSKAQRSAAPVSGTPAEQTSGEDRRLPAASTTHHSMELPGRTLHFAATAGALLLNGDKNAPRAELAFIAFQLDGVDPTHRPITFAFNGGPGFASGWLNVGAVGPWRISLSGDAIAPSADPEPMPNAETWLDFTDLVFIDP